MAQNAESLPYERSRPGCVTAYAVLIWLGGAFLALGTLSLLFEGDPSAICGSVFVILTAVIGYGLWQMQEWSWWLVIILQSLSLIGSLLGLVFAFTEPSTAAGILSSLVSAAVSGGILYWFATNRSLFSGTRAFRAVVAEDGTTTQEPVPSTSNQTGIIIAGAIVAVVCIIPAVIIAILTLLGPQIGNVFSRITSGLGP